MYVRNLECSRCREQYEAGKLHGLCRCGSPLLVNYDLESVKRSLTPEKLAARQKNIWRYREVLPVRSDANIVCLGEGFTPLIKAERLGRKLGLRRLYIKDESSNPTGTFKARGLAVAVSMAKELGVKKGAIPSAGNAASAFAAYAARAGIEAVIFMPKDAPEANRIEAQIYGARLELVDGLITDAAEAMAERKEKEGWFDFSTLKEPYRVEGKKTMGYELAEQMCWTLPDVIVYPTGGGTGLIGMWKAFAEMEALGWIDARRPCMVSVQAEGCAPLVRALEQNKDTAEEWPNARTIAAGLRVPRAIGDFLALKILRESGGTAVAVSDADILRAVRELAETEGMFACPEGAATLCALRALIDKCWIDPDDRIVLFNTGSGLKYLDVLTRH